MSTYDRYIPSRARGEGDVAGLFCLIPWLPTFKSLRIANCQSSVCMFSCFVATWTMIWNSDVEHTSLGFVRATDKAVRAKTIHTQPSATSIPYVASHFWPILASLLPYNHFYATQSLWKQDHPCHEDLSAASWGLPKIIPRDEARLRERASLG